MVQSDFVLHGLPKDARQEGGDQDGGAKTVKRKVFAEVAELTMGECKNDVGLPKDARHTMLFHY